MAKLVVLVLLFNPFAEILAQLKGDLAIVTPGQNLFLQREDFLRDKIFKTTEATDTVMILELTESFFKFKSDTTEVWALRNQLREEDIIPFETFLVFPYKIRSLNESSIYREPRIGASSMKSIEKGTILTAKSKVGVFLEVEYEKTVKGYVLETNFQRSLEIVNRFPAPLIGIAREGSPVYGDMNCSKEVGMASGEMVDLGSYSAYVVQVNCNRFKGWMYTKDIVGVGPAKFWITRVDLDSPEITQLWLTMESDRLQAIQELEFKNRLIKLYGTVIAQKILQHKYWIGMTRDMAILSIGEPDDINRTVTASEIREQWVYSSIGVYLYFRNGICTTFQD